MILDCTFSILMGVFAACKNSNMPMPPTDAFMLFLHTEVVMSFHLTTSYYFISMSLCKKLFVLEDRWYRGWLILQNTGVYRVCISV